MSAEFDERVMTVPLRDVLAGSNTDRADKAMRLVRSHLAQHFNVEEDAVRLDPSINESVWERGRSKPPRKLRVRAARFEEEGEAVVEAETA
ncbi:50S ribosomal protein L31e [Natronomonas moolapensis 8.8.11]|jgi:large subunit ribosomal protein L31e|uniref:Large ribosomal subunit protein eL31 n=1 Tax=Natronomonas moolapensis (strain DSM 18674 / CECT 7526 / JCM 14361 / 8.8.11) TaxID=268739 RepID=M1XZD7_NATM8|nr:50S ribosomal protein L31e [Natronomonas moolapensis]CCQ35526.1 50S ribosomal protein L31e [Natronomonas moolapensis 8.8.11]